MSVVTTTAGEIKPLDAENWADYLTPEQRIQAIAEILATGALRILKERHEQDTQ